MLNQAVLLGSAEQPTWMDMEPRLRQVLEAAGIGFWEYDFRNRTSLWSEETCELFGVPPQHEPISRDWYASTLIHPEDRQRVEEALLMNDASDYDIEYRIVRPDGEVRAIHSWGTGLCPTSGRLFGAIQDVTETKRLERRLHESKQRYESLKKYHPDGICAVDLHEQITGSNPSFQALTGYSHEELKLMRYESLWVDDDSSLSSVEQNSHACASVCAGTLRHKSGRLIQVESVNVPIVVDGCLIGMYAIVKDVTEKRRTQEALQRSQSELNRVQAVGHVAHWELDLSTKNIRWGEEADRIYGLPSGTPVTMSEVMQVIHPEDRGRILASYTNALLGQVYEIKYRVVHPTNDIRFVRSRGRAVFHDGVAVKMVGVIQDVTDKHRSDEALETSRQRLEHAERLSTMGQMAAGIVHEIRNPLAAIMGFTQLLQEKSRGDRRRYVTMMMTELKRVHQVLGELLFLARPQKAEFTTEDVCSIVAEVVELMDKPAAEHQVCIDLTTSTDTLPVSCDRNQLKQVLINVVKNAIEAMEDGGTLQITAAQAGNEALLTLSDEGIGISPERLAHLGSPFFTTKESGSGLGLMVSFRIIENHGGHMKIDSTLGIGTTVRITLPAGE